MDASSHTCARQIPNHAGLARVEALAGLIAAGVRIVSGWIEACAVRQRRERNRRSLLAMDDHRLRDLGLHRSQIDQLFR